ncbi:MAG: hypothetical protein IT537_04250 [Hyphomicrobiales bacterium]|nr:hypothetical protein [Hyphomicrobiales bacterium]
MQDALVTYIELLQADQSLANWEIAARLKISESNWSHIKQRRRLPHRVFERAVIAFPGLVDVIREHSKAEQVPA